MISMHNIKNHLSTISELAHDLLMPVLVSASAAVDATAGNGLDTLFMARILPPEASLYAFDIQKSAIEKTAALLQKHQLLDRVVLLQQGHEEMDSMITGPLDAVIFNLGYLPNGDHAIVTNAETTIKALQAAMNKLVAGGRIAVTVYPGHPEGYKEKETLENWLADFRQIDFKVLQLKLINAAEDSPFIILIEKTVR